MDLGLDGRVAWVTGATSGLGRASAVALAREGALVAVSSRDEARVEETARAITDETGSRALGVPLDVTDADGIRSAAGTIAAELGPIEVLVGNAGGPPPGPFDAFDDDDLYAGFTLTTASAWRLAKAVVPGMRQAGGGALVYITSGSTKEVVPNLLLSNMMRAAVVGMAKTLSKELAADGIRVLCVAPGRIETPRLVQLDEATSKLSGRPVDQIRAHNERAIPAGRYGRPEEFGDAVAFLASQRASYISGVNVSVDGAALNFVLS